MLYVKALHIIFVVTWFAGLFYIVRLFVYHAEAMGRKGEAREVLEEQFKLMQRRLWYGITWPSMICVLASGLWLLWRYGVIGQSWMLIKLGFVVGLVVYHLLCGRIFGAFQRGEGRYTSTQMRIWNEVATLFLVAIVFLVVLKSALDVVWGVLGLVGFGVVLMLAIRAYRRLREKGAGVSDAA